MPKVWSRIQLHTIGDQMTCVLCGDDIGPGDVLIKITLKKYLIHPAGHDIMAGMEMDDGSMVKVSHLLCAAEAGTPMALLGNGRDSFNANI